MADNHSKLWAHLVWKTKDFAPLLTTEIRRNLIKQILAVSATKDYYIASINGGDEHLHCLISYLPKSTLLSIINEIRKESSQWLNSFKSSATKFIWQQDFAAFSVSESKVKEVKMFIAKQEEHHLSVSFAQEWKSLLKKHNI